MSVTQSNNDSLSGISIDGGRYIIGARIGEGGMGQVYRARQTSMDRMVAVKILRKQLTGDSQLLERFQREARSVSRLRHPNTITVFDYGRTEDGYLFIAMELLGGRSLYQVLRSEGPMDLQRTLNIIAQVAGAVAEAHTMGVVHRDLKPENIQIDRVANTPDFAKVLDFGIAKIVHGEHDGDGGEQKTLTLAGAVFGTPHYMSPEQVHGRAIDARTDVYSLGVILFEMLTGKPPFDGATPMAVMMAQASKVAPDPLTVNEQADVTDEVAALISDCLQKDPDMRPASMEAVIARITEIRLGLGEPSVNLQAAALTDRSSHSGGRVTPMASAAPTPDFSGQLDSLPETDFRPGGGRRSTWLVALVLVLGVGGVLAWQLGQPDAVLATDGGSAEPHRVAFSTDTKALYKITSTPAGALVFADPKGSSLGRTPAELRLDKGVAHTIHVRLAGYAEAQVAFEANTEARTGHVTLVAMGPKRDWVRLESDPPGAEIYRGANRLGVTPFEWRPEITVLPVELRFVLADHEPHFESVSLQAAGDAARPLMVKLVAAEARKPAVKPTVRRRPPVRRRPATKPPKRPASKAPASKAPKVPASTPPKTPASHNPYNKL